MPIILDLPGITGVSQIDGYAGKIGLDSFSHGVNFVATADVSNTERAAGKAYTTEFSCHKELDATSPLLNQHCCEGKVFPTATITVVREDAGVNLPLIVYTMTNAMITSISVSGSGDSTPHESLTINFASLKWDFSTQKEEGGKKGTIQGKWDFSINKAA